jgi:hypothetical protein
VALQDAWGKDAEQKLFGGNQRVEMASTQNNNRNNNNRNRVKAAPKQEITAQSRQAEEQRRHAQ